jgi:hypothetical protein
MPQRPGRPAAGPELPGGTMFARLTRSSLFMLLMLLLIRAAPAAAAVEISFHSKDFGTSFPHAFIVLTGTVDATGEPVSANYGFTVRNAVGPSVLLGRVRGVVDSAGPNYVEHSNRHFSMLLSDEQFRQLLALVERWHRLPQPSYSLDRRNCVTFVAEVAVLLGLEADTHGLMRRPRAFLDRVRERNAPRIAAAAAPSAASTAR